MFFNKLFKKTNTVNLNSYTSVYADTNTVVIDGANALTVLVMKDGISVERWNVADHFTGDTGVFHSADEIIDRYNVVDTAAQARILEIVAAGEL